jgi:hypothetical protein
MGDVTKGDGISDVSDQDAIEQDWGKAGEGRYGGIILISGLSVADCLAYPISDQLLITPWSCVSDCSSARSCEFALITSHDDPKYYGLTEATYHLKSEEGTSLALLQISEQQSWSRLKTSTSISQGVRTVKGAQELISSSEQTFEVDGPGAEDCEYLGLGLFNVTRALVGLRTDMTQCAQFLSLAPFMAQLNQAIDGDLSDFKRVYANTDVDESDAYSIEEPEMSEEEILWSSEEEAAQAEAEACTSGDSTYCVGDVEMTCRDGVYKAFNCQRVGWKCIEDPRWGFGCNP